MILKKIISGGQTGADQAALDAAIKYNLPHGYPFGVGPL
jgi:predicted Rossmann fold nucleotide-binding protein DprA/Smf involved in DNA uptake